MPLFFNWSSRERETIIDSTEPFHSLIIVSRMHFASLAKPQTLISLLRSLIPMRSANCSLKHSRIIAASDMKTRLLSICEQNETSIIA